MAIRGKNVAKVGESTGSPVLLYAKQTVAGTTTYTLFNHANQNFNFRVVNAWVVMTGAGGAGDTVKLTDGTNDITNTMSVAAAADKDVLSFSTLDDAYHTIGKGDKLQVVTASDALCLVYVEVVRV